MNQFRLSYFIFLSSFFLFAQKNKVDTDLEWELNRESRYFYDSAAYQDQLTYYPSIAIRPTYSLKWNEGYENLIFSAYFCLDRDSNRTYWDLREFYYQKAKNNLEINIGFKKVFWGVTESNHLVDIINQTDALKSFDGEEKLGQPMVQLSWFTSGFGTLDFYYLPYHRKREFPGKKGRFRFDTVIDGNDVGYESKQKAWHPDFAVRWKHYIGILDIGLSYFNGNGREPFFQFDEQGNIDAYYPLIDQYGVDLQITAGALLLKFESIYRDAIAQKFFAFDAGFEFTFTNIDKNGLDIGVLGEYLYDERGDWSISGLQDDIFYGIRVAFNDTQDTAILAGGIHDLETNTNLFTIEGSRRFKKNFVVSLETRVFSGISEEERFLLFFKQDSLINLSVSKYF